MKKAENVNENDMASFLRIPIPGFMVRLYRERKLNIAFIPYTPEWREELLLSETPTDHGGMEYLFKRYDFIQLYDEDDPFDQVTRRFQAFAVDESPSPEEKKKTPTAGFKPWRIIVYFR